MAAPNGDDESEVIVLILRGQVERAVDLICEGRAYRQELLTQPCDGCERLLGHTRWCPLKYWR
jgi:hypothetical protein